MYTIINFIKLLLFIRFVRFYTEYLYDFIRSNCINLHRIKDFIYSLTYITFNFNLILREFYWSMLYTMNLGNTSKFYQVILHSA